MQRLQNPSLGCISRFYRMSPLGFRGSVNRSERQSDANSACAARELAWVRLERDGGKTEEKRADNAPRNLRISHAHLPRSHFRRRRPAGARQCDLRQGRRIRRDVARKPLGAARGQIRAASCWFAFRTNSLIPLESALAKLAPSGLRVSIERGAGAEAEKPARLVTLEIVGNERPGIVRDVTQALTGLGVNIEEFTSGLEGEPFTGVEMFRATARLSVPDGLKLDDLRKALEKLAAEIMVDLAVGADGAVA